MCPVWRRFMLILGRFVFQCPDVMNMPPSFIRCCVLLYLLLIFDLAIHSFPCGIVAHLCFTNVLLWWIQYFNPLRCWWLCGSLLYLIMEGYHFVILFISLYSLFLIFWRFDEIYFDCEIFWRLGVLQHIICEPFGCMPFVFFLLFIFFFLLAKFVMQTFGLM